MVYTFIDHPLYPEWRARLDDVVIAQQRADEAGAGDQKAAAEKALHRAQMRFSAVSDDMIWVPLFERVYGGA
jgi:hypothetical protein